MLNIKLPNLIHMNKKKSLIIHEKLNMTKFKSKMASKFLRKHNFPNGQYKYLKQYLINMIILIYLQIVFLCWHSLPIDFRTVKTLSVIRGIGGNSPVNMHV